MDTLQADQVISTIIDGPRTMRSPGRQENWTLANSLAPARSGYPSRSGRRTRNQFGTVSPAAEPFAETLAALRDQFEVCRQNLRMPSPRRRAYTAYAGHTFRYGR